VYFGWHRDEDSALVCGSPGWGGIGVIEVQEVETLPEYKYFTHPVAAATRKWPIVTAKAGIGIRTR
jgi:hypothetical protein